MALLGQALISREAFQTPSKTAETLDVVVSTRIGTFGCRPAGMGLAREGGLLL